MGLILYRFNDKISNFVSKISDFVYEDEDFQSIGFCHCRRLGVWHHFLQQRDRF
jgi:hypothetical protein